MDSILGKYSIIWVLDYFAWVIQLVYGFKVYVATLFESLCQRLRAFYSFNTVILNSVLHGNSFHYAEKIKRTVEAIYFLQTMNHLCSYQFADIKDSDFYDEIVNKYLEIESEFLKAKKSPDKLCSLEKLTVLSKYYDIVDEATKNPESSCAFILTLAVHLYLGHINEERVLEQVNSRAQSELSTGLDFFKGLPY